MYYNKVEALREKEVAEKLINSNDYVSARDKLLKARQLFPSLEHIVAMLTVCDILSASKNKIPGYDTDYYWVLHLMPSSSISDIKCRYQKLLNLLVPIKKKFPGTELALKLIKDAFSVLSDEDKRSSFDLKRETSWAGYQSLDVQASFNYGISARETGITRVSSGEVLEGKNGVNLSTDMLSERVRDLGPELLANHNINKQCANVSLQEPSACSSTVNSHGNTGEEIDMPMDDTNLPLELHQTNFEGTPSLPFSVGALKRPDQDFYDFGNIRKPEFFETGQVWATHYQSDEPRNCRYALIKNNVKSSAGVTWLKPVPISDGERRWCDAGLPVACGPFCLDLDKGVQVSCITIFSYKCLWVHGVTEEQFEIFPKKGEIWALYEDWDIDEWSYNPETVKGCKFKFVEMLSDFSKYLGVDGACLVKTDGFRSIFERLTEEGNPVILHISPTNLYMLSHMVPAYRVTGGEIDGLIEGMFELDNLALPNDMPSDSDNQIASTVENSDSSVVFTGSAEQLPSLQPLKPYPESKILEATWSLNEFNAGQIWAVYSGKASMPRQYARINNVSSGNQVCVSILEPQPIFDYEKIWKKQSLPIVCGMFGTTGTNVNLEISQFSHVVRCQQSTTKSVYKIYPMKNEIWAMYKNWNKKWKYSDYENSQFQFVEILSDFTEGSGMMIARLTEVKGCLTFFHRQQFDGFDLTRTVSKPDLLSFSHRIPAYRVPGIGHHGIPESSWHLEPNALACQYESESCTIRENL
ncbi:unnamed protein product [Camellia sinensis]